MSLLIFLSSCLDDPSVDSIPFNELNKTALILGEIEERGDYVNSDEFPALINADQLFKNLAFYCLIDVRSGEDFEQGHIQGSVNLQSDEILDYVLNIPNSNCKIVLISNSGQAAAYYTSLLRLYGIANVYSLKFGMASWNKDFENQFSDYTLNVGWSFKSYYQPDYKFTSFPEVTFSNSERSLIENYNEKVRSLFKEGFDEVLESNSIKFLHNTVNTLNFGYLFDQETLGEDHYIMITASTDILQDINGPRNAVYYHPFPSISDIASGRLLQTIPTDKIISVYSYSGQISAMIVAHLRLLGYNAKSILFGVQNVFNTTITNTIGTGKDYVFLGANNYPYIQ